MTHRIGLSVTALLIALVLSGCQLTGNNSDSEQAAMEPDRTIEIVELEFSISPADISVKKGEVIKFEVKNEGRYPHTYTIEGLGTEASTHPGETESIVVAFDEPGQYKIRCMIAEHDKEGMVGTITVK